MGQGDNSIVSRFGLDGKRQHWVPGNRRRGTGATEKRPFASEEAARTFIDQQRRQGFTAYLCEICERWHIASPKRAGQP